MKPRLHPLSLATAALTTLELTRAEMEFEGHWRRSTSGGPSTFVIPLAMDSGWYHSAVRMGSNNQKFNFSLSGSTGYTVVAGQACNACGNQNPLYSSQNSSSFQSMNELIDIAVDGVNQVFGSVAKENCGLKQTNGSWWEYNNQTILVAGSVNDGTRDVFNAQISGILGLAPTTKVHSYTDTVLGAWLQRHPQANQVSVGFALKRPDILNATTNGNTTTSANSTASDAGEMHMLAPDSSSYYGELVTVPTVSYSSEGSAAGTGGGQQMQAAGWVTNLEEWTFSNSKGDRVSGGKGAHAAIDPWYSTLIMPRGESENIFSKIPGSQLKSSSNDPQQSWNVPCNTRVNLTISIAGIDFVIDPHDLIAQGQDNAAGNTGGTQKRQDAMCACAVQGWTDPSVPGYMLGSSFMRNAYIVYNVAQANGSQQNSIGFGRRFPFQPSKDQAQRARTTGIVVGTIAGVIILLGGGALAWLWRRSQQKAHRAPSEEFMSATPKRFNYISFKTVGSGFLGRTGGATIAPGVIFNARRGSDPEVHPLMQTPPTTSSPPRDGVPPKTFAQKQGPITVHVEDMDRNQGLHLPAHQVYLDRLSQKAESRGLRWPGSEQGYAPINDQDMDAHAFGDHAKVYSDDSERNPHARQRYDPPPEPAASSNWNQPYHPPSASGGNRVSMVVEPITKPAEVALREEPNQMRKDD